MLPTISEAVTAAGRSAPRVAFGLPISLTDDVTAGRAQLAEQAAWYSTLPAYRSMFEREGVGGPAEVALLGDERMLDAGLARLADAGATDYLAQIWPTSPGSASRTLEYLTGRLPGTHDR